MVECCGVWMFFIGGVGVGSSVWLDWELWS